MCRIDRSSLSTPAKISLLGLVVFVSTLALAADYVSTALGFKANFPGEVQLSRIEPNDDNFIAYSPDKTWAGQVQVISIAGLDKTEITNDYMDSQLKEIADAAPLTVTSSHYATFQGYPAVAATGTINAKAGVVDVTLLLVFTKNRNRMYVADVLVIHGGDHSFVQPFLDSFEIR
jgi:hypothetical protein